MKKVLILGIAPAQRDAILELKKMGIKTYACAQANDGPGSEVVDHFEIINFMDYEKVVAFIKKHHIDCVHSIGSDIAILIAAKLSENLGLPRFISSDIAKTCNNKDKMRAFFGNAFEGNVKFQLFKTSDEAIILDYPFIMKPSDSQGQRGVRLITNYREFLANFEISRNYSRSGFVILEDYIEGPEISVNTYLVDSEVVYMVASDRVTWPQFQGGLIHKHVVPSIILNDNLTFKLKDLVYRTAKKLTITNGPLYFQIKIANDKPYIIEVTPRLDGCHMWNVLEKFTGVNLIKLIFEHLLSGNTRELEKYNKSNFNFDLEFLCALPNLKADYSDFNIPEDAIYSFKYYRQGEIIRPINGQYEKIGYFISQR